MDDGLWGPGLDVPNIHCILGATMTEENQKSEEQVGLSSSTIISQLRVFLNLLSQSCLYTVRCLLRRPICKKVKCLLWSLMICRMMYSTLSNHDGFLLGALRKIQIKTLKLSACKERQMEVSVASSSHCSFAYIWGLPVYLWWLKCSFLSHPPSFGFTCSLSLFSLHSVKQCHMSGHCYVRFCFQDV